MGSGPASVPSQLLSACHQTSRQNIHGSFTAKSKQKHYFSPDSLRRWAMLGNWCSANTNSSYNCDWLYKTQSCGGKPFNCLFISVVAPSSVPTLTQLCKMHRQKLYSILSNQMTSNHGAASRIWNVTGQDWLIEHSGHCLQPQTSLNILFLWVLFYEIFRFWNQQQIFLSENL